MKCLGHRDICEDQKMRRELTLVYMISPPKVFLEIEDEMFMLRLCLSASI